MRTQLQAWGHSPTSPDRHRTLRWLPARNVLQMMGTRNARLPVCCNDRQYIMYLASTRLTLVIQGPRRAEIKESAWWKL